MSASLRRSRGDLLTLREAVASVIERHGSLRAAESATGVNKASLSRLVRGLKASVRAPTLRALGLRPVALYEVVPSAGGGQRRVHRPKE